MSSVPRGVVTSDGVTLRLIGDSVPERVEPLTRFSGEVNPHAALFRPYTYGASSPSLRPVIPGRSGRSL